MISRSLLPCAFALSTLNADGLVPSAKERFAGAGEACCVCGQPADTHGHPWKRKAVISESFGPAESLSDAESPAVCGSCAFFAVGRTFVDEIRRRELPLKTWASMSWRSYSHIFTADTHIVPKKSDWRSFLLSPPEPPFVAAMTSNGTKNILYRSVVSEARDVFPLYIEDTITWVMPKILKRVLADFEAAYVAGFGRDAILRGEYGSSSILKVGIARWRALEKPLSAHRAARLPLMRLAHIIAERPQPTTTQETEQ
jgi:hypothetical protein